jgi:UDPglucose 6-dehydrogenase
MIKYASNSFLATRISFINEIAAICEQLGADVKEVALGMGYDKRIGPAFLEAGLGFGGSCFPKDVKALMRMARDAGQHPQLLEAVMEINRDRRQWVLTRLRERLGELTGKRIALWGIAFKPNTDDIRDAPALEVIRLLQAAGAQVVAYDPAAMPGAARVTEGVHFAADPYAAAMGAEAVVLITEWNEFRALDLTRVQASMRRPLLVDGRNLYDPATLATLGFEYLGVARAPASDLTAAAVPVLEPLDREDVDAVSA